MAILSQEHKSDHFESHRSLKLTFFQYLSHCSNFSGSKSFLESNSWHSYSMQELLWFCYSYGWSCNLCEGGASFCTGNSQDSYLYVWLALLHSVSYFFFLYLSPFSFCTISDSVLSNGDEVLSINPSANVFGFEDFNVHHKDWLTYSCRTGRSDKLCHNFPYPNFPTRISDCDSHSLAFLDLFLSADASTCSTAAFPPLKNSDHIFVSVFIVFPSDSKGMRLFIAQLMSVLLLIGTDFMIIREMLHDRILNLVFLLLVLTFVCPGWSWFMYPFIINIRLSFIHLHGFQLLVVLP